MSAVGEERVVDGAKILEAEEREFSSFVIRSE